MRQHRQRASIDDVNAGASQRVRGLPAPRPNLCADSLLEAVRDRTVALKQVNRVLQQRDRSE
jgi:hypothetical protein